MTLNSEFPLRLYELPVGTLFRFAPTAGRLDREKLSQAQQAALDVVCMVVKVVGGLVMVRPAAARAPTGIWYVGNMRIANAVYPERPA